MLLDTAYIIPTLFPIDVLSCEEYENLVVRNPLKTVGTGLD
jgi:hypothetical protein